MPIDQAKITATRLELGLPDTREGFKAAVKELARRGGRAAARKRARHNARAEQDRRFEQMRTHRPDLF